MGSIRLASVPGCGLRAFEYFYKEKAGVKMEKARHAGRLCRADEAGADVRIRPL